MPILWDLSRNRELGQDREALYIRGFVALGAVVSFPISESKGWSRRANLKGIFDHFCANATCFTWK